MKQTTNNLLYTTNNDVDLMTNLTLTSFNGIGFNVDINGYVNIDLYVFSGELLNDSPNASSDEIYEMIKSGSHDLLIRHANLFSDSMVLNQSSINYYLNDVLKSLYWDNTQTKHALSIDIASSGENTIYNIYPVSRISGSQAYMLIKRESIPFLNYIGFKEFIDINSNDSGNEDWMMISKMNQFRGIIFQPPRFVIKSDLIDYAQISNVYFNSLKFIKIFDQNIMNALAAIDSSIATDSLVSIYDVLKFMKTCFYSAEIVGDGFICKQLARYNELPVSITTYFQTQKDLRLSLAGLGLVGNSACMFNVNSFYTNEVLVDFISKEIQTPSPTTDEINIEMNKQAFLYIPETTSFTINNNLYTWAVNFYSYNDLPSSANVNAGIETLTINGMNIPIIVYSATNIGEEMTKNNLFTLFAAQQLSYKNMLNINFTSVYFINNKQYIRFIPQRFATFYNEESDTQTISFDPNFSNIRYLIN